MIVHLKLNNEAPFLCSPISEQVGAKSVIETDINHPGKIDVIFISLKCNKIDVV